MRIYGEERPILVFGKKVNRMNLYIDLEINKNEVIREFSQEIDPIELKWHRDDEDRIVEAIEETDWMIQLDNQLPKNLNQKTEIPRHVFHRIIKGTGSIKIKIIKL